MPHSCCNPYGEPLLQLYALAGPGRIAALKTFATQARSHGLQPQSIWRIPTTAVRELTAAIHVESPCCSCRLRGILEQPRCTEPTAAVPVDYPYCSCKLTRVRSRRSRSIRATGCRTWRVSRQLQLQSLWITPTAAVSQAFFSRRREFLPFCCTLLPRSVGVLIAMERGCQLNDTQLSL